MFYTVNIPRPPSELTSLVKDVAYNKPINLKSAEWHSNIQPPETNCAAGLFFIDEKINRLMQEYFQKFFSDDFISTVGIIHNIKSLTSSYPPHSDKFRRVGLNYYIDLGGTNVETVFYNNIDDSVESDGGSVLSYNKLCSVSEKIIFEKNKWYLFHTRKFHSVENIETTRCLLTISFLNIDFIPFQKKYKHLLLPL